MNRRHRFVDNVVKHETRNERPRCESHCGSASSGPMPVVDKDGKTVPGECRNRIIDEDHFEITEVLDGKAVATHFHRVKDKRSKQ